ncbi:diguanylate cyclase (GGDEF)-like protein [Novosphingobium chloroacetimidivorans]|uniref:diguanylate cyclase n=1 Tax=Novosphingobium chloroacetimidivorans TaxID=1428314 RepID=A0A7W7NYI0_9SPHN|nr:diguanylate cyclase [Novosphingobium chloroacetimidivorans]MBB4860227.1 diguanylate cyclase (GGDEF)-like protein [Novosphingobium chloroacetimidivorans]
MIEDGKRKGKVNGAARPWATAGTLYFLLAAATIHFSSDGRDIATFWPANAVLTAMLLLSPRSKWWQIVASGFVANAAANLVTRGSVAGPLLYGLSNVLEVLIVSLAVGGKGRSTVILSAPSTLLRFVLVAGLLAPLASGIVGAATAYLLFGQELERAFATWVLSDALGLLIFTPVFLALFRGDFCDWYRSTSRLRHVEALAHLAATASIATLVFFGAQRPLLFLIYAPVMFVTFRVGPLGTKVAVMLVALIGAVATMQGYGPIVMLESDTIGHAHMFQLFIAVMLLTCLPVAAEVSARARMTAQLAERERELSKRAVTDPLTGVLNRSGLDALTAPAPSREAPMCLVALDVDHFKQINDRWGHAGGDRALSHLAEVLRSVLRPHDVVCRTGGDEFVLLLPGLDIARGQAVCARILNELRGRTFSPDGVNQITIALSCGVAVAQSGEGYEATLRRADDALYRAKAAGRNAVRAAA